MSPSLHTSMEVTVRWWSSPVRRSRRSWQNHGVRSDKMLLPSSYPHPVYNGKNKSTNAPLAPETAGSGYDIHMFFHCHSNGDENPAPPPQKAGYGYPPEVSGSVHRKIFPRDPGFGIKHRHISKSVHSCICTAGTDGLDLFPKQLT